MPPCPVEDFGSCFERIFLLHDNSTVLLCRLLLRFLSCLLWGQVISKQHTYFLLLSTGLDGEVEKYRYIFEDLMTTVINFTGWRKIFSEFYIWNMETFILVLTFQGFKRKKIKTSEMCRLCVIITLLCSLAAILMNIKLAELRERPL